MANKEIDLKQSISAGTRQVHDKIWEEKSHFESQYNHRMQRKIDKKMRNSNTYELVGVICHTGRSKALGQFYSYVKRTIKSEFMSGVINELISQQDLANMNKDSSSDK